MLLRPQTTNKGLSYLWRPQHFWVLDCLWHFSAKCKITLELNPWILQFRLCQYLTKSHSLTCGCHIRRSPCHTAVYPSPEFVFLVSHKVHSSALSSLEDSRVWRGCRRRRGRRAAGWRPTTCAASTRSGWPGSYLKCKKSRYRMYGPRFSSSQNWPYYGQILDPTVWVKVSRNCISNL